MTLSEGEVQLLRGAAPLAALALGLCLERIRPHAALRPAWLANVGLWAIGSAITVAVCGACGYAVAAWAAERGFGLLNAGSAPTLFGVAATLLGLDAVSWVWHWANHRLPALWRFHRVHHSDEAYHVTTALRFHPGEILLALPLRLAAIAVLGASPLAVLIFEAVFGIANVLEHGNFDVPARVESAFGRIVITPAQHRFHHARVRPDEASNFGTIFTIWDRIARSFAPSDSSQRFETGVPSPRAGDSTSLAAQLLEPLRPVRGG